MEVNMVFIKMTNADEDVETAILSLTDFQNIISTATMKNNMVGPWSSIYYYDCHFEEEK